MHPAARERSHPSDRLRRDCATNRRRSPPTRRGIRSRRRFLTLPGSERIVDLLFASSGIEAEVVDAAEELEVLPDLRALSQVADDDELQVAKDAVVRMSSRGYDRGRDLTAALDALLGR